MIPDEAIYFLYSRLDAKEQLYQLHNSNNSPLLTVLFQAVIGLLRLVQKCSEGSTTLNYYKLLRVSKLPNSVSDISISTLAMQFGGLIYTK